MKNNKTGRPRIIKIKDEMKEKDYRKKLKDCADTAAAPDILDGIKMADFSAYRIGGSGIIHESDIIPKQPMSRKRLFAWTASAAAALAFIFIFSFVILPLFSFDNTVYATASVGVSGKANYLIEVNQNSQVIDITADNQTGREILENFSYKKNDFDSVLTALLNTCADYWDFTEEQLNNSMTFSVSCHDSEKKTSLEHCWNSSMSVVREHCRSKHHGNGHN